MKNLGSMVMGVGLVSLALGIAVRLGVKIALGLSAMAFLNFTNTCLLLAIALLALELTGKKS